MCTLPILPKDCSRRAGLPNDSLPAFYMADHSVLGLLIGRFDEALQILEAKKFGVIKKLDRFEINLDSAERMHEIMKLFRQNGIDCMITDIVDQVYQG